MLSSDKVDTPFGGPIPDADTEGQMDVVMESIQGQKINRKQSIDALKDKIKENPKSSAAARKEINGRLKETGILDKIKKAKGKGSAKEPDDKEAYDVAVEEKNAFLLNQWQKWEKVNK